MTFLIVVGLVVVALVVALLVVLGRRGSSADRSTRRAPGASVADNPAFGMRDKGPMP